MDPLVVAAVAVKFKSAFLHAKFQKTELQKIFITLGYYYSLLLVSHTGMRKSQSDKRQTLTDSFSDRCGCRNVVSVYLQLYVLFVYLFYFFNCMLKLLRRS